MNRHPIPLTIRRLLVLGLLCAGLAACGLQGNRSVAGQVTPSPIPITPTPTATFRILTIATAVVAPPTTTPATTQPPTATITASPTSTPVPCTNNATFIADVTIPDGSQLNPGTHFSKIWRIRNSGTCSWQGGYRIEFVQGDRLSSPSSAAIPAASPGETIDIGLPLVAPQTPGRYQGTWRLRSAAGQFFGTNLITLITVPDRNLIPTPILPPGPGLPDELPDGSSTCPVRFADWPTEITRLLNINNDDQTSLTAYLRHCNVLTDLLGGVFPYSIQYSGATDLVVVIHDLSRGLSIPPGMLLVYHDLGNAYNLAFEETGNGRIDLLAVEDLNLDGRSELAWSDTVCGASTCTSTLAVEQWSGANYRSWIEGSPEMASASYHFADTTAAGQGREILASGGIINSAGAGPQRARTETYISPQGGPYRLDSVTYEAPTCLYHAILDANDLFNQAVRDYPTIINAYEQAIHDPNLHACWTIPNELETLRDFARFRQVLAYRAIAANSQAQVTRDQISYRPLRDAADVFINTHQATGSLSNACQAVSTYATANPASWNFLADWGYANPSFSAAELCPGFGLSPGAARIDLAVDPTQLHVADTLELVGIPVGISQPTYILALNGQTLAAISYQNTLSLVNPDLAMQLLSASATGSSVNFTLRAVRAGSHQFSLTASGPNQSATSQVVMVTVN